MNSKSGGIERAQIPVEEDGEELVQMGAFRVLETFDEAADEAVRDAIRNQTRHALRDYPELAGKTVTIGRLDPDEDARGRAWFYNLVTLYPVDQITSMQTVYHELAHLAIHVRRTRGEDVPITSEEYCSIFAVSRMSPRMLDRDDIAYLGKPDVPQEEWPEICQRALEYREDNRNYIQKCKEWLAVVGSTVSLFSFVSVLMLLSDVVMSSYGFQ